MVVTPHIVGAATIFGGFARTRGCTNNLGDICVGGGGPIWGKREYRDSLGAAVAGRGSRPSPRGGRRSRLVEHRTALLELVGKQPGPDLAGNPRSPGGRTWDQRRTDELWRFLKAQKITLKKRAYTPPNGIAPM